MIQAIGFLIFLVGFVVGGLLAVRRARRMGEGR